MANYAEQMPGKELRRNILTIRFKDREHRAVYVESWKNHMTMSGWIRGLVLDDLKEKKLLNYD